MSTRCRIVIFTPKGLRTGGPEAIHQFHHALKKEGQDSILIPWPGTRNKKLVQEYSMYEPSWGKIYNIRKKDIVVIPCDLGYLPIWYLFFISSKNIYLWMLAVDFSYEEIFKKYESRNYKLHPEWIRHKTKRERLENKNIGNFVIFVSKVIRLYFFKVNKRLLRFKLKVKKSNYLFQSDYANQIFRIQYKSDLGIMISDYVSVKKSTEFGELNFCTCESKHVAYFPGKSQYLIQFILEINSKRPSQVHFIAIRNLNRDQVISLLSKVDLYLDLGFFPGKDRLPREAIILKCPVLIAKRGAARYYRDFQLDERYLLDLALLDPHSVYEILLETLSLGKEVNLLAQNQFENSVLQEEIVFKYQVKQFIAKTQKDIEKASI